MACSSWHKFISNKRYFLDQRPLSLSEPLLSTLKVEHLHPPRECFSSPLVEGVFDLETTSIVEGSELSEEQNNYSFLCDADLFGTFKSITSKTLGNKELLKWVFVVLNVLVEVCQAAISEEKNEGKLKRNAYLKLSIITSFTCLMMAIIEAFVEGKKSRVVWKNRGGCCCCCWFYYPGNQGQLFGKLSMYFGLISSMTQLIINITEKLTKNKTIVQFDYIPLLLAVCYLVAAICGAREKKSATPSIRCSVHTDVEGTLTEGHGGRLFQCPQCLLQVNHRS